MSTLTQQNRKSRENINFLEAIASLVVTISLTHSLTHSLRDVLQISNPRITLDTFGHQAHNPNI